MTQTRPQLFSSIYECQFFWEQSYEVINEWSSQHGMEQVNASRLELGGFGWWFASKKVSNDWSIHQLVAILEIFRKIDPDFAVVNRLAELAHAYPYQAVHCLGIIFEEDRDGWAIHGWGESPQTIISEALKGNEQSRARTLNLGSI